MMDMDEQTKKTRVCTKFGKRRERKLCIEREILIIELIHQKYKVNELYIYLTAWYIITDLDFGKLGQKQNSHNCNKSFIINHKSGASARRHSAINLSWYLKLY